MAPPVVFLALLHVGAAHGSAMDTFGPGAASASMGGGGTPFHRDAAGVFLNPADVVTIPTINETLLGYQLVRTEFQPFPDLWWDVNQDGLVNEDDPPLQIQPDYEPGDGLLFATEHRFGRRVAIGGALFLPHDRILSLYTFEASQPNYFMYDSRLKFYAVVLAGAVQPVRGVSLGVGVRMIPYARIDITATIDATVTTADEDDEDALDLMTDLEADIQTMQLRLVPTFAPFVGFRWDVGEVVPQLDGVFVAGTWRGTTGLPVEVDVDLQADVHADDLGDLGDVVIPISGDVLITMYDHYLPEQWVVGLGVESFPFLNAYVDLRFTRWSGMNMNVAQVATAELGTPLWKLGEGVIRDGNPYVVEFRDTWSFRAGGEFKPFRADLPGRMDYVHPRLRIGAGLEPYALVSQTSQTAFLDSDRLILSGGAGMEHKDPFRGRVVMNWDLFYQHQVVWRDTYLRDMPDTPTAGYPREADAYGQAAIPIGGKVWTGGLQLDVRY